MHYNRINKAFQQIKINNTIIFCWQVFEAHEIFDVYHFETVYRLNHLSQKMRLEMAD